MKPDEYTSPSDTVAAAELRQGLERAERLHEERRALDDDLKELWAEYKGRGYDVKAMKVLLRERRMDQSQLQEQEAILDLYRTVLGMA